MYEKYTTDALVVSDREHGEFDKVFALYTRDFGLVYARASAVRKMHSKMRPALALFSHASVSLVRGTRGWRITGARAYINAPLVPQGAHACGRIMQLTLRLVHGEERNEYLFNALLGARAALVEGEVAPTIELLCVARVLYALGYLSSGALTSALFVHAHYATDDLAVVEEGRTDMLRVINSAIAETQL